MILYPRVLVRVAGESINVLEKMDFSVLVNSAKQLDFRLTSLHSEKLILCQKMLDAIKNIDDSKSKNLLQNVRRDIFNNRKIKDRALLEIEKLVRASLRTRIRIFLEMKESLNAILLEFTKTFNSTAESCKKNLYELAESECLQNGLLLSSHTFYERLIFAIPDQKKGSVKRNPTLELSLLKYISRICTKTSPFSTFGSVALGVTTNKLFNTFNIVENDTKDRVRSCIRLNNTILRNLRNLLGNYRLFYLHMKVRLNSTIRIQEYCCVYLTNHNNIEAFQTISNSKIINLICRIVDPSLNGEQFHRLILILRNHIEATSDEIENYLKKLLDVGFLEFDWGISGRDGNWSTNFITMLTSIGAMDVPLIRSLVNRIEFADSLCSLYGRSSIDERKRMIENAYTGLKEVYFAIAKEAGVLMKERITQRDEDEIGKKTRKNSLGSKGDFADESHSSYFKRMPLSFFSLRQEQLFYEDSVRNVKIAFDHKNLLTLAESLNTLITAVYFFRGHSIEKEKMRFFFELMYKDRDSVDLLIFYEDYYREVKRPEFIKSRKVIADSKLSEGELNESILNLINGRVKTWLIERNEIINRWNEGLKIICNGQVKRDEFRIDIEMLRNLNKILNVEVFSESSYSHGAMMQFFPSPLDTGEIKLKGVLNTLIPGYGKMFSRFVHLFDHSIADDILELNLNNAGIDEYYIENNDGSFHNANLHPGLLDKEIKIPGGNNNLPLENQIAVCEFKIELDTITKCLNIKHVPTGKKSYFFDWGFEGHKNRSELFQMLNKFSKIYPISASPLVDGINEYLRQVATANHEDVMVSPRIVYDNSIIVQRKGWVIPYESIPKRESGQSDSLYYITINQWRKKLEIGAEAFININPKKSYETDSIQKLGRDDYKPQYLNFENPLFINLFEKLISKKPTLIKIEEMLPNSSQLAKITNEGFVTEMVFQWYGSNEKK